MKKLHLEKFNRIAIILLIIGIGIGLLITAQWKTRPSRVSNPVAPYLSLRETRNNLTLEQENLKKEIKDRQSKIEEEQQKLKKYSSSRAQVEEIEKDRVLVGLTELKDSGVVITMDDSKTGLGTIDSITHAADLRDLVNFLWAQGAQAISINEERIVFPTSIDCIVNTILINSTKTTPPFTLKAIDNSDKIIEALNNENNLKDIHKRVKTEGLIFEVRKEKEITISAYDGSFTIEETKIIK